jgi:hypothetical protein
MQSSTIAVQRFSVTTAKPFDEALANLRSAVSHPERTIFQKELNAAKTEDELKQVVGSAAGTTGLMEFAVFDLGGMLPKELGSAAPKSARLLIGNPIIMKQMVRT